MGFDGEKVKYLRYRKGWSGTDLANAMGVAVNQVYRWEGGKPPGPRNLRKLADALGVEISFLFVDSDYKRCSRKGVRRG
jgi:transcriptional regulator with XRE-family HTH domain